MRDAHPIKHALECENLASYETSAHNQNTIGCENLISTKDTIRQKSKKIIGRSHVPITMITKKHACIIKKQSKKQFLAHQMQNKLQKSYKGLLINLD